MKKFTEFLTESQKTYKFKVRVAGELPEKFEDHMESSIEDVRNLMKLPLNGAPSNIRDIVGE